VKPTKFSESTKDLAKPVGWDDEKHGPCSSLPVFSDGTCCISRWAPTWRERFALIFGRPIWVFVHSGWTQPPIALSVEQTVFTTAPPSEESKP